MMWRRMDWVKKKRIFRYFLILTKVCGNDEQNIPFSAHSIHTIFSLLIKQFPLKRVDILCPFTFTLSFVLAKKNHCRLEHNNRMEIHFVPFSIWNNRVKVVAILFNYTFHDEFARTFDTRIFHEIAISRELSCQNWIEVWWTPERIPYQRQFILQRRKRCRWKMMNRNLINSLTWKTSSIFNSVVSL